MARMHPGPSTKTADRVVAPAERPARVRWSTRRRLAVGYALLAALLLVVVPTFVILSAVGGNHTLRSVAYAQTPPHSGDHAPVWLRCGFYSEPVRNENAVHSLEHGIVWVTCDPGLAPAQVETLRALARASDDLIVSPFAGLPSPVVVSAWEQQLALTGADDPRRAPMIAAFRANPLAPEPGAGCDGPNLWFTGSTGDPRR